MLSDEDVKSGDLSCTAQLIHTLGTRGVRWFHRPEKNLSHHIAPYTDLRLDFGAHLDLVFEG